MQNYIIHPGNVIDHNESIISNQHKEEIKLYGAYVMCASSSLLTPIIGEISKFNAHSNILHSQYFTSIISNNRNMIRNSNDLIRLFGIHRHLPILIRIFVSHTHLKMLENEIKPFLESF